MFKSKIKYLLPLCLSMVFLLSFCLIVNAETCTSCSGLGYVMSYSNYKEKCSYCSGTALVWQAEITEKQSCYNCHDGIIYLYFDCTVCNATGKWNCDSCKGKGQIYHNATYRYDDCPECSDGYIYYYVDCACDNGLYLLYKCDSCSSVMEIDDYMDNNCFCRCGSTDFSDYYITCATCDNGQIQKSTRCSNGCNINGLITVEVTSAGYSSCNNCNGTGTVPCEACYESSGQIINGDTCPVCKGSSVYNAVIQESGYITCNKCDNGYITKSGSVKVSCTSCNGSGLIGGSNIVISSFNDYCVANGLGDFPYFDEDTNYIFWYYSDLGVNMLYAFPKSCNSDNPVWYEKSISSLDGSVTYLLNCDSSVRNSSTGYMYNSFGSWSCNVEAWEKSLSTIPDILYSDVSIQVLSDSSSVPDLPVGSETETTTTVPEAEKETTTTALETSTSDSYYDDNDTSSGIFGVLNSISSWFANFFSNFHSFLFNLFVPSFSPITEFLDLLQSKFPIGQQMYVIAGGFIYYCDFYDYTDYEPYIPLVFSGSYYTNMPLMYKCDNCGLIMSVDDYMNNNCYCKCGFTEVSDYYNSSPSYFGYDVASKFLSSVPEYYKGVYNILDASWYAPYRDIVNNVLSCFIWLGFAFSVIKYIPKMLGGI